jgi:hypothetical protein
MIRTRIIFAAAVALGACETTNVAAYDPQSRPPPAAITVDTQCLRSGSFIEEMSDQFPTPSLRCAPRYPMRAQEAGLTASCLTVFTVSSEGAVQNPVSTCAVGEATRDDWRAYGKAVFEAAARGAIARYAFAPDASAAWQGQSFAVRTKFLLEDAPIPDDPRLPVNVVEIPSSRQTF